MKPARILPILWLATSIGVFIAASQDWYAIIQPAPGLARIAATGLESFPILASIPWISLICLFLVWYLGSIGRLLVAAITALLALAGVAQLAFQTINTEVLLDKLEKATGIRETVSYLMSSTVQLWPRYLTLGLLIVLAAISVSSVLLRVHRRNQLGSTRRIPETKDAGQADARQLWDEQDQ